MVANSAATLIYWEGLDKPRLPGASGASSAPVKAPGTAPWVRFSIVTADNADISPGYRDDMGQVVVQVFGPLNVGAQATEDLAETIAAQFRRRTVTISGQDRLNFGSVRVKEIGPEEEGWYQVNVLAAFSRKEAA